MKPVEFFSEGVRLSGDLYLPEGEPQGGVVLCHGYTGVKNLYFPDVGAALAAAGYAVLAFDYKGWGESDGAPTRLAPFSRVADAQAAITYLSLQHGLAGVPIGLFGFSFGGSVAAWVAAVDPRVSCIVSVVAVANGERWMRSVRTEEEWDALVRVSHADRARRATVGTSELVPRTDVLWLDPVSRELSGSDRRGNEQAVERVPLEFVDETLTFNPESIAGEIRAASLFITCKHDVVVPPEESHALYERAGGPKKLVVLDDFGHYDIYRSPALERVMLESLSWYAQHFAVSPYKQEEVVT